MVWPVCVSVTVPLPQSTKRLPVLSLHAGSVLDNVPGVVNMSTSSLEQLVNISPAQAKEIAKLQAGTFFRAIVAGKGDPAQAADIAKGWGGAEIGIAAVAHRSLRRHDFATWVDLLVSLGNELGISPNRDDRPTTDDEAELFDRDVRMWDLVKQNLFQAVKADRLLDAASETLSLVDFESRLKEVL